MSDRGIKVGSRFKEASTSFQLLSSNHHSHEIRLPILLEMFQKGLCQVISHCHAVNFTGISLPFFLAFHALVRPVALFFLIGDVPNRSLFCQLSGSLACSTHQLINWLFSVTVGTWSQSQVRSKSDHSAVPPTLWQGQPVHFRVGLLYSGSSTTNRVSSPSCRYVFI